MMVGTVSYMPPEQAMGGEVTPRSDLYSLGAMLYELVTGRPPFVGDESVAIITQHLNTPPVAPPGTSRTPAGLEALILRLLEKDPTKRPAAASEVRQALASCAHVDPRNGGHAAAHADDGVGQSGPADEPAVPPHLRRPRAGAAAAPAAFDAALSGQGALVAGRRASRASARPRSASSSRPTRRCAAAGPWSATATRRARCRCRTCRSSRPCAPTCWPGSPRSCGRTWAAAAAEVARIVSEVRDRAAGRAPADRRIRRKTAGGCYQAVTGFLRNASAGAAAADRARGPALGGPRHARPPVHPGPQLCRERGC